MGVVLWLLAVQGALGAFDTVWYHEVRARLPTRPEARRELLLHSGRDFLYAILFSTLPWVAMRGAWIVALAGLLLAEIGITLADFVIEDETRRPQGGVFPGERATHAIMGIVYGAMLGYLLPELWRWEQEPTSLSLASIAAPLPLRILLAAMAAGVAASGVRDLLSAVGVKAARWPHRVEAGVGTFYEDFRSELARWGERYATRPKDELLEVAFLSLEREQLVSVTYHDDLLARRLAMLPVDPPTRELIRHALAFTWKDEEMHAVYVRGLLWREGRAWLRARANWHFVTGLVAGWATFVQQHVRWRDAPVSRAIATGILWGGLLTGTAPPSVRQHLRYHSFREFCAFNVDAERTATLAWDRLAVLGRRLGLDPRTVALFERIRDDEVQHQRLFELLVEALGPDDALAPGWDAETLAARIGAIHPEFLPRPRRSENNPLGAGGRVAVSAGAGSREAGLLEAVKRAGLAELLATHASGRPLRVAVKTSFMLGVNRDDRSPIVSPESVSALVGVLRTLGAGEVKVLEAPTLYDRFLSRRSVSEVAAYFGFDRDVADASADRVSADYPRGMVPTTVSASWRDADLRIVLGKLRTHPVNLVMLGLSALEGLGERADAFHFAERMAAPEVAVVTLAARYPPHFSVLDGWDDAPDGIAGMLGSRSPRSPHRFYAGRDTLAVDLVAARHLGLPDPYLSRQLRTAIHWFGDPRERIDIDGCDAPITDWRLPWRSSVVAAAVVLSSFVYAHASRRGALFVPPVDERAFPPLAPPSTLLRAGRRAVWWALGLSPR